MSVHVICSLLAFLNLFKPVLNLARQYADSANMNSVLNLLLLTRIHCLQCGLLAEFATPHITAIFAPIVRVINIGPMASQALPHLCDKEDKFLGTGKAARQSRQPLRHSSYRAAIPSTQLLCSFQGTTFRPMITGTARFRSSGAFFMGVSSSHSRWPFEVIVHRNRIFAC